MRAARLRRLRVLGAAGIAVAAVMLLSAPSTRPDGSATAGPAAPVASFNRPEVHTEGPPPGHTGGFGEPSCRTCHAEFDLDIAGSLTFEGLPSTYEPGATYVVSIVLRSTDMERAGFQAAARFYADTREEDGSGGEGPEGRQAGVLQSLDARTAVVADSTGTIQYVQHVAESAEVDDPEHAAWSFQWTAPKGTSRAVVFHAAANSANGDDSPLGDLVYTEEHRLTPSARPAGPGASGRR